MSAMNGELVLPPAVSHRYAKSIAALNAAFSDAPELIVTLLHNCEMARTYAWPEKAKRTSDTDARAEVATAVKHARGLARFCRRYPTQTMAAVAAASIKSHVHLRLGDDTERGKDEAAHRAAVKRMRSKREPDDPVPLAPSYATRFANLLNGFAGELATTGLLAKAGPMTHRWRHGPLYYPRPIDDVANLPGAPVCLAIVLSFLLRLYSLHGRAGYQAGEPYPTKGRPRWAIVQELVAEAFGNPAADYVANARQVAKPRPAGDRLGLGTQPAELS
jgi:hypothetical protein